MAVKCQLKGLEKRFGAFNAVDDVSLEIEDGEFIVILGPSGCGKPTTMRLIAGLESPSAGTISIDGNVVSDPTRNIFVPPERRDIGMVFQSYAIWPHMTVYENVAYPLRVRSVRGAELDQRVKKSLDIVGLAKEVQRSATALSGGQMQRVALARALVANPKLLLFDEPLSNLDLKLRERLRIELKELQRQTALTSIYVTHDQAEAVELADRIVVMQAGQMVQVGSPAELYRKPRTRFVAEFISAANIFEAVVVSLDGQAKMAHLRTEKGRSFIASTDHAVKQGDKVEVIVHPEDCSLIDGARTEGGHAVEITQRRYQGTSTRYTVIWGGEALDVITQGTSAPVLGTSSNLHILPGCARIIQPVGARP